MRDRKVVLPGRLSRPVKALQKNFRTPRKPRIKSFQSLEILRQKFPKLGSFYHKISKPWKFFSQKFQTLESRQGAASFLLEKFPMLGSSVEKISKPWKFFSSKPPNLGITPGHNKFCKRGLIFCDQYFQSSAALALAAVFRPRPGIWASCGTNYKVCGSLWFGPFSLPAMAGSIAIIQRPTLRGGNYRACAGS